MVNVPTGAAEDWDSDYEARFFALADLFLEELGWVASG
jgi:hypothetical protein